MATFEKRGTSWRVQIKKGGQRASATFATKAEAQAWATKTEAEIIAGKRGDVPNKTFGQLLERYRDEVSVTKRGERWERLRIGLVLRDPLAMVKLADLDERSIAAWRDRRLAQVSAASVRREWNLLSSACTIALKEWKWLKNHPMKEVKRPAPPEARDRIATDDEIERLLFALGYEYSGKPETASARVGTAMLFGIETAMRAGEIAALTWADVDMVQRFLRIRGGKTSAAKREVPLSPEALRILRQLGTDGSVFHLTASQIDSLFRKAKGKALVEGLTFHDLRHTAITRLAKRLDVLALARMVGHRDLKMLLIYFNPTASEISHLL